MVVSFFAKCVAVDETDDYWLVGFADEEFETREHFMLTRSRVEDGDSYYAERNDQGLSCFGGVERFVLHRNRVLVTLTRDGAKRLRAETIEIGFSVDDAKFEKLNQQLQEVFAGSECLEIAS